jgi:hypothetical protein
MAVLMWLGIGLIVLALVLSDGGNDSGDSTTDAAVPAPTPGDVPASGANAGKDATAGKQPQGSQSGGSAAAPESKTSGESASGGNTEQGTQTPAGDNKDKSQSERKRPAQSLAELSPEEREKLHGDLYKQGLEVCGAYGPQRLAEGFNLPSTDPAQLAKLYAEAYEANSPSLVLPVQQGCLAGLKRWIKRHQ